MEGEPVRSGAIEVRRLRALLRALPQGGPALGAGSGLRTALAAS